jgi:hypothetical protein
MFLREGVMMGNNFGKWDKHYKNLEDRDHYIDTETYYIGSDWLEDCETVEDWGCGKGWFKLCAKSPNIISIDGSHTPFADKVVDLEEYTSDVDGIFMRAVAEHNFEWKKILQNLLNSFNKKAFVAFFTPMSSTDEAQVIDMPSGYENIPDISIPSKIWEKMIKDSGAKFSKKEIKSDTSYNVETYYKISR